jgi:hypothetical protein
VTGVVTRAKPRLKVGFYDFWPNHQPANNYFYHVLSSRFRVEIDDAHPDAAIFSVFGDRHRSIPCRRKYHMTGETRQAPDDAYDYSFTFGATSRRNYRLPLWVLYIDWFGVAHPNDCNPSYLVPLAALAHRPPPTPRPRFCNFVFNRDSGARGAFLDALAARREVDSLGALRNNQAGGRPLGGDERTKIDAQRDYRFTIAFENTIHPGYVTEKLVHPLAAQSVPIYWGCPEVAADFNPAAFLDARDYPSLDALADEVMAVDADPARWQRIAAAPVFSEGGVPAALRPDAVADFFEATL